MIHLAHLATLTADGKVDIAVPYQQALKYVYIEVYMNLYLIYTSRTLKSIREAVKQAAEMVLERANSTK